MKNALIVFAMCAASVLFNTSQAAMYVVETRAPLSPAHIQKLESINGVGKLARFLPIDDEYLNRLYEVDVRDDKALESLAESDLVKLIEADHAVELYEIKPNKQSEMFTSDMLYPFQWGLQNQEQIVSAQTPNGGPEETNGVPGKDIAWKSEIEKIEKALRKEPRVAVIDMGIDIDHPELKDNLYKNEEECDEGKVQAGKREDRDGNGLPGDCLGWNFAATSPIYDAHPTDDKGHGTHVSGIIAAKRNNDQGISGVSDKIKILPVRVTGRVDETEDRNRLLYRSASRRIAKGIFYAVHRKVDVINLSLGWPKSMNTNYMKRAIGAAIQNNVLIVAAAGNNNSNANVFPCAFREVVCVGSIDVDGKVSRFSNFGGAVDILAPGDQIVSTIPTAFIPLKLNIQGYDIMSGTSQAAPFVSAAAAMIKSVFPGMPNTEVMRRLYDSAQKRPDDFKSMHGLLQMDKAMKIGFAPSVKPVFKQLSEAIFDPRSGKFRKFILNFKNYGKDASNVKVRIQSLSSGIGIAKSDYELGEMKTGAIEAVEIPAEVRHKFAASNFRFKVSVSGEDMKEAFYIHEVTVAKDLYATPDKSVVPIEFASEDRKHSLISFRREYDERTENRINQDDRSTHANLRTIDAPYSKKMPSYFLLFSDPKVKGLKKLFFFDYKDGKLVEKKKSLTLEDTVQFEGVTKLDLNYDGKEDFLVRSIKIVDQSTIDIQYRYLNSDLEPLFPDMPVIHYHHSRNTVAVTPKTLRYVKTELGDNKYIATPVFVNKGGLHELDQVDDPWSPKDRSKLRRIYRLELEQGDRPRFRFRTFMNIDFIKKMRRKFKELIPPAVSADDAGLETIGLKYQSKADYMAGKVEGVFSFGLGFERSAIQVTMESGKENKYRHLSKVDSRLVGNALHPVKELDANKTFDTNAFVGFLTNSTVNVSHLNDGTESNFVYRLNTAYDRLMSFVASYKKGRKSYVFFETIDDILMVVDDNGNRKESRLSTTKFSFLPGKVMSDIFYPIALNKRGELNPAIYIDTTAVSGNRIYAMTNVNGQLAAPAHLSVDLPSTCGYEDRYCGSAPPQRHYGTLYCVPMNPVENQDGSFSYMALCKNKTNYEMLKVDLNL